jgi:hypothetical protein
MASSSKRRLRDTNALAAVSYHPTKGFRRVSLLRVIAQSKIEQHRKIWSKLGAAVA